MSEEKAVFVTGDAAVLEGGKISDADARAMNPAGFVEIKTVDQLMALAEAAKHTYETFDVEIKAKMTPERAARVRELRCGDVAHSWRAVAEVVHEEWGDDATWSPPSNQLAGMALCARAAELLGEDGRAEPWN